MTEGQHHSLAARPRRPRRRLGGATVGVGRESLGIDPVIQPAVVVDVVDVVLGFATCAMPFAQQPGQARSVTRTCQQRQIWRTRLSGIKDLALVL
jgi:hypothetical protein